MMNKVYNLKGRTGLAVRNQYVIDGKDDITFQSYSSICAIYNRKKKSLILSDRWNYSKTTSKYFWQFMRNYLPYPWSDMDNKKLKQCIKEGKVKVVNSYELERSA